jgi:hypothetical protein
VGTYFVPHLLTLDQKHQHPTSSFEFGKMIDDDRNALKKRVMARKVHVSYTIQKHNYRVQLG